LTDTFTEQQRSQLMSRVRNRNTVPEVRVRSLLHQMGYRFRLHRKDLPGTPDIVFPKYRKIIFVHGCFWHGHNQCKRGKRPETNTDFWNTKINKNITRDINAQKSLLDSGWSVTVVWECEIADIKGLQDRLKAFLA